MTDKSKTESKEEKTSEWTLSKTIKRIIGYSLCFFFLWVAITELLPNSSSSTSSVKGLLGVIIIILLALIYPISDILILLGKDKGNK